MFVKNDKGEYVLTYAGLFVTFEEKQQGMNEIGGETSIRPLPFKGAPASGYSTGQAIAAIQEVAKETLPRGFDIDWQGLSYDEANAWQFTSS